MDTEAYKLGKHEPDASELKDAEDYLCEYGRKPARLNYEVRFGRSLHEKVAFATFELALAFYRGYLKCQDANGVNQERWTDDGPKLVNAANIDGAEDSSAASQHGLTQIEWDALQEVG